jgi:uncharacterized RDD family membrane protein YckC
VYPLVAPRVRRCARTVADVEVGNMMDSNGRPPLATVLNRFAAILLDGIVPMVIAIPLMAVGSVAGMGLSGPGATLPGEGMLTFLIFLTLVTYLGFISYSAFVLAMWAYGLTPGKWIMGIRVVRIDNAVPASFWRMVLRQTIGYWLSAIICYLGFLWALFDANRQTWHDKLAKTLVIQTR